MERTYILLAQIGYLGKWELSQSLKGYNTNSYSLFYAQTHADEICCEKETVKRWCGQSDKDTGDTDV